MCNNLLRHKFVAHKCCQSERRKTQMIYSARPEKIYYYQFPKTHSEPLGFFNSSILQFQTRRSSSKFSHIKKINFKVEENREKTCYNLMIFSFFVFPPFTPITFFHQHSVLTAQLSICSRDKLEVFFHRLLHNCFGAQQKKIENRCLFYRFSFVFIYRFLIYRHISLHMSSRCREIKLMIISLLSVVCFDLIFFFISCVAHLMIE
jgi:hypothetical protein